MKSEKVINNVSIILVEGDITELDVQAIVNPANESLILGGGVAGAIREKGGPSIQKECSRIGGTYVGGAVITSGGNLKPDYIIHAVGPRMGEGEEDLKLKNATMNSLLLAEEKDIKSIAFPAISTGIFGFPMDRCAKTMLEVVTGFVKRESKISQVYFCLWGEEAFKIFDKTLQELTTN